MGRKRIFDKDNFSDISFRLTQTDKEALRVLAAQRGQSMGAFVRATVKAQLKRKNK